VAANPYQCASLEQSSGAHFAVQRVVDNGKRQRSDDVMRPNEEPIQMIKAIIIVFTLVTAAIHLSFFLPDPGGGLIYGLNALGYMGLLALLYLPIPFLAPYRRWVRWLLMGFTALTIVAYLIFGVINHEWTFPLGPIDKLIEVVLIGLLWQEDRSDMAARH
jgi:hypothetical protein